MPDDFLADLSRWWREGWQAGQSLPSPGPTVGRGLFSNWFLTEREREDRELEALYGRVRAKHDHLLSFDEQACMHMTLAIFGDAFEAADQTLSVDTVLALYEPVKALVEEEFFWLPDVAPGEFQSMHIYLRADARNYLLRKERFFTSADQKLTVGRRALAELVSDLLRDIEREGFLNIDSDAHELTLQIPLSGVIHDVPDFMDRALAVLCHEQKDVFRNELFALVRHQLMRNLAVASGINPDGPTSEKPFTMPSQARCASNAELVERYFAHTPLQDLLEASLPISVPERLRTEHALIIGGSGHGKTQTLLKLIHHDLTHPGETPPGIIVMDSQGDLIRTISRLALFDPDNPHSLADRLILIDPSDVEYPVALNLFAFDQSRLDTYSRGDRERVLNSAIALFEYFFSTLLGAELTQKQGVVFRYLARLMMVIPDATVQTLRELMEDGRPYKEHMNKLTGSAKRFFKTEFFAPGFAATKKQILRRLWGVLSNPVFERMFSHPDNRVDLFDAMNEGKIVLIHTSKDHLKAEGCSIFGRFFLAQLAHATLERSTLAEDDRRMTYAYIDEASDYFDETLEHLFNQARKFNVAIHCCSQNLDQLPAKLRATVLTSTSLKFAGGVSAKDARALAEDMNTDADFIRSMRKRRGHSEFAVYVKNRTATAIPVNIELGAINELPMLDDDAFQRLIDQNRERYCVTLDEVETIIESFDADDIPVRVSETPSSPRKTEDAPQTVAEESTPAERPEEDAPVPPPTDARQTRKKEIDEYVAGIGGREHTKLQRLVRRLAQDRDFKATIEKPVLDGAGSVDVALEHDDLTIAVEINISTDITYEIQNIQKGFNAGFDEVVLIVPDSDKRARAAAQVDATLTPEQKGKCHVLGTKEFQAFLNEKAAALATTETIVRGYRVTRTYRSVSPEEARFKRETIAKALAHSTTNKTKKSPSGSDGED